MQHAPCIIQQTDYMECAARNIQHATQPMHRKDGRPCSGGEERCAGGRKCVGGPVPWYPSAVAAVYATVPHSRVLTAAVARWVTDLRQRSAVRVDDRLADVRPDLTEGTLYSTHCNAMPEAALLQRC